MTARRPSAELTPALLPSDADLRVCFERRITYRQLLDERAGGRRVEADVGDAQRLEKAEGAEVDKVLRAFGGSVYNLSQSRASKQTPGLPDRWVFFPRNRFACWFEVKRQQGGVVSEAQVDFEMLCIQSGTAYRRGGRKEAEELVISLGLAYRDEASGALEPVRKL